MRAPFSICSYGILFFIGVFIATSFAKSSAFRQRDISRLPKTATHSVCPCIRLDVAHNAPRLAFSSGADSAFKLKEQVYLRKKLSRRQPQGFVRHSGTSFLLLEFIYQENMFDLAGILTASYPD